MHTQKYSSNLEHVFKLGVYKKCLRWLEEDDNLELWHDKISAKQRRVLMTKWTAEAWKELTADKLFFMKLFERTGCLITADGSDDDKIRSQALEPYSF